VNRIARAGMGALLAAAVGAAAAEQKLEQPQIHSGDSWTYRVTDEKGSGGWTQSHWQLTVTRVTGSSIYFKQQQSESTQPPRETFRATDWSYARDVNGKETVVDRPFQFPLSEGKSWKISFGEDNPSKNFRHENWDMDYHVVGYETIEVPAGKFQALKVEAEGRWTAQVAPAQNVVQAAHADDGGTQMASTVQKVQEREVTGRLYRAYWYAPEVKRWVKSVDEDYSSGGVRSSSRTTELESFKAGG
jgi:hypothetical protein